MSLYQLTLRSRCGSSAEFRNIFHYEWTPGFVPGHAEFLALATAIATPLAACISTGCTIYQYDAHNYLEDTKKWNLIDFGTLALTGLRVGDELPYQVAAVILGYTGISKHIAKKWLGPISETDQAGGVPVAGLVTLLEAFATAWQTPFTTGAVTFTPHSWSKVNGALQITRAVVSGILGTQRRRKPGVGI